MVERRFDFALGEYYHIYNRGNSKQEIFLDNSDYRRFQKLLFLANSLDNFKIEYIKRSKEDFYTVERKQKLVAIGAYCLMPNHFHILLTPLVEGGVSIFMKKLGTGYSMYFNKRYERTGGLFEGRFKAQMAENDVHLKYLFSYIYLNPLKIINPLWRTEGVKNLRSHRNYLETYRSSSFSDHLGVRRSENKIIDHSAFPNYFETEDNLREEVFSWFFTRIDLSDDLRA